MTGESEAPPDDELRRRRRTERRRKAIVYGGSGGTVIAAGLLAYFFFFAAVLYTSVDEALGAINHRYPAVRVYRDPRSGYVAALSNLEQATQWNVRGTTSRKSASDFVARPEVAAAIGLSREVELRESAPAPDPQLPSYEVVRIQQFVEGVRLFGADIAVIQRRSGSTAAISAIATRPAAALDVDLTPAVDEASARTAARNEYLDLAKDPASRLPPPPPTSEMTSPERVIFDPARFGLEGAADLAWRYQIGTMQVFVNARNGRVIAAYDNRSAARNRLIHDCRLTLDCPLVLNEKGALAAQPPIGADARQVHDAALAAHSYFKQTFQRDGFDDAGSGGSRDISAFVQVADFDNAQWDPGTKVFEFGQGWATLDIAAHEYIHAVTTFGPQIEYLGQAGAVSEFFADFFGVMVDRSLTGVVDWKIGEGLPGRSAAAPLRSMATPHNGGFKRDSPFGAGNSGQPETFDELVKPSHAICANLRGNPPDRGCVHFNSGILSKALHLAVAGGTFNGTTIPPIALAKVEQIMFRTLMLGGVTSSPTLLDAANGAVRSCRFLAERKLQNVELADCTALRTAFVAVKIPVAP